MAPTVAPIALRPGDLLAARPAAEWQVTDGVGGVVITTAIKDQAGFDVLSVESYHRCVDDIQWRIVDHCLRSHECEYAAAAAILLLYSGAITVCPARQLTSDGSAGRHVLFEVLNDGCVTRRHRVSQANGPCSDVSNQQRPVTAPQVHWHQQPLAVTERDFVIVPAAVADVAVLPADGQERR